MTKKQLRKIIREEYRKVLKEGTNMDIMDPIVKLGDKYNKPGRDPKKTTSMITNDIVESIAYALNMIADNSMKSGGEVIDSNELIASLKDKVKKLRG